MAKKAKPSTNTTANPYISEGSPFLNKIRKDRNKSIDLLNKAAKDIQSPYDNQYQPVKRVRIMGNKDLQIMKKSMLML